MSLWSAADGTPNRCSRMIMIACMSLLHLHIRRLLCLQVLNLLHGSCILCMGIFRHSEQGLILTLCDVGIVQTELSLFYLTSSNFPFCDEWICSILKFRHLDRVVQNCKCDLLSQEPVPMSSNTFLNFLLAGNTSSSRAFSVFLSTSSQVTQLRFFCKLLDLSES